MIIDNTMSAARKKKAADKAVIDAFDEELTDFLHPYVGVMKLMCAKLEFLDSEFSIVSDHNPIHHMQCRLKSADSIFEKAVRKGIEPKAQSIRENIFDIAGIRVICNYVDDVYKIAETILQQSGIKVIKTCDYIKAPKPNGYRSLHIVVSMPITCFSRQQDVAVEIQLRTIAMDMWASLEHELIYKSERNKTVYDSITLKYCADELMKLDKLMQSVYSSSDKISLT